MKVDIFGDGDDLLWVMGLGNQADSRHERWLIDRLVDAGYRVHAAELPTNDPDFTAGYVQPVDSYLADLDDPAVVTHSMGGLVTVHVGPDRPVLYLSPWWGTDLPPLARPLLRIPTTRRIIPSGISPDGVGELATAEDVTAPGRLSPAWLRAMVDAQDALPPLEQDDFVLYSPDDETVSVDAIRAHAGPDQRETYEGGHELFASADRESHVERLVDRLARQ